MAQIKDQQSIAAELAVAVAVVTSHAIRHADCLNSKLFSCQATTAMAMALAPNYLTFFVKLEERLPTRQEF